MIRILLSGATGAMGNVIRNIVDTSYEYEIVAGFADVKEDGEGFNIYQNMEEIDEEADLIIDFSSKATLGPILKYALAKSLPLVLASTGYDEEDLDAINDASKEIPIVQAGNFSLGVNVMVYISKLLAELLEGFDIEIVEAHHNKKKDAPSGTANMLFDAVNEGRGGNLQKVYGRSGFTDKRDPDEVGIHSLRAGTISGNHEVIFAGDDEIVKISHHAASKKIFALGALNAAKYIIEQKPGLIDINEILNIGE